MSSQSKSSPTNALFWRLKCTFMASQRGRSPTFTRGLGPPTASSSHHFYPIPAQQRQYWPISEVASLSRYVYLIGAVRHIAPEVAGKPRWEPGPDEGNLSAYQ